MGMTSGRKAAAIASNSERVLAIEALCAAQGLDLRAPLSPAPATAAARDEVREVSAFLEDDRPLGPDIEAVSELIQGGRLLLHLLLG